MSWIERFNPLNGSSRTCLDSNSVLCLQMGHLLQLSSHRRTHAKQKQCWHPPSVPIVSSVAHMHIEHSNPSVVDELSMGGF